MLIAGWMTASEQVWPEDANGAVVLAHQKPLRRDPDASAQCGGVTRRLGGFGRQAASISRLTTELGRAGGVG